MRLFEAGKLPEDGTNAIGANEALGSHHDTFAVHIDFQSVWSDGPRDYSGDQRHPGSSGLLGKHVIERQSVIHPAGEAKWTITRCIVSVVMHGVRILDKNRAVGREAKRLQRRTERSERPADGVDPDIAGIVPGPQPPVDPLDQPAPAKE